MTQEEKIAALFPKEDRIPAQFRLEAPLVQDRYLVGGTLKKWEGPRRDVLSPVYVATPAGLEPKLVGRIPLLTATDALEALEAAVQAFDGGRGQWPTLPVEARIKHLEEFCLRMKDKREEVVKLLMWEIGKSLKLAQGEFDRTITYLSDTIEALKDLDRISARFQVSEGIIGQIRRSPLGVVLSMGPYNYPLNETFTTLIPALLMGNTAVMKPPKLGVLIFSPLLEAFRDCFPPGVVNIVYGEGRVITPPLMATGKIDVLAFIGTSGPADSLEKQHPKPHRLRSVLGLEAKNPAIVLEDADLELAVAECIQGSLTYNGQRCTALKILFVHSSIAEEFLERLSAGISALGFGMPWEPEVTITPLPEPGKTDYLGGLVREALDKGARVVNPGGGLVNRSFFHPAAVYPVTPAMRLYSEEQFGPVIPVVPFDTIETPIRYIRESNYGQQVSIFGTDPDTIAGLIDPLVNQVSRVNLNSQCQRGPDSFPFTGRKDSAEGTLSVSDALRVFSIRSLVAAKARDINKAIITNIVRERKSNFLSTDYIL